MFTYGTAPLRDNEEQNRISAHLRGRAGENMGAEHRRDGRGGASWKRRGRGRMAIVLSDSRAVEDGARKGKSPRWEMPRGAAVVPVLDPIRCGGISTAGEESTATETLFVGRMTRGHTQGWRPVSGVRGWPGRSEAANVRAGWERAGREQSR